MRCKDCGTTTKRTHYMCWEKWQLCVKCAVIKHPEEYDPRQVGVHKKPKSIRYGKARKKGEKYEM
jgi:hypothetical protein